MARLIKTFRCEIVTPEGGVNAMGVTSVVFPATDGLVGVMAGRAPMVAHMGGGPLMIDDADGKHSEFYVSGGFAQMNEDLLTIIAEEGTPVEKLDREAVWEEIQQARKLPMDTDAEIAHRDEVLSTARTKFQLIQKRRKRHA